MAFPQFVTHFDTSIGGASPFAVNMPINVAAGGLLVVQIVRLGGAQDFTFPAGWIQVANAACLHDNSGFGGTNGQMDFFCKVTDAGDVTGPSGGSITVSSSVTASQNKAAISMYFTGNFAAGTTPVLAETTVNTASSGSPDSPSFTPVGGAKDYLWCTAITTSNYHLAGLYPSSYTKIRRPLIGGNPCRLGIAGRELNTATEDPQAWSSITVQWSAKTLAIFETTAAGRHQASMI